MAPGQKRDEATFKEQGEFGEYDTLYCYQYFNYKTSGNVFRSETLLKNAWSLLKLIEESAFGNVPLQQTLSRANRLSKREACSTL
ncbi:MAG: hypothetical protein Q9209_003906 [Squamulea sp. 1 TL-2023]